MYGSPSHTSRLDWPIVIVLTMVVGFAFGLMPWGRDSDKDVTWFISIFSRHKTPPEVRAGRPDILLVSNDALDRFSVIRTVEARGYTVLTAPNVEVGMEQLLQNCSQIGVVVLDSALPSAQRVVAATNSCRGAGLLELTQPRQPSDVARSLMTALFRQPGNREALQRN